MKKTCPICGFKVNSDDPMQHGIGFPCGIGLEAYKPSQTLSYVIESDGDQWFAHYDTFTNVAESDEVAFGSTPQEALQKFLDSRVEASKL